MFHFFFFFFFFSCFSPSLKCPVSYLYPPFFYFLFLLKNILQPHIYFTSQRERERKRERKREKAGGDRGRQKDKAGGDRRSPCNTTTSATPLPLILLPTTRLDQIDLFFFFFFFFFFSYLLGLIQLYCKNWILFCVLCLDYVRRFLRVKQRD